MVVFNSVSLLHGSLSLSLLVSLQLVPSPAFSRLKDMLYSEGFIQWMEQVTGIEDLRRDKVRFAPFKG